MAPKGKQGTKGSKQIVEENAATLKFYRNMSLGACSLYFIGIFLFSDPFSIFIIMMSLITVGSHFASYQFMVMMSRASLSDSGSILDSGTDLNMEGGIAEHVKDIIILTSIVQTLALFSNYFWFFLLLAPIRAIYMLWGSVIQPWLSQGNEQPNNPQQDDKKQKKMDRKMKRMQNIQR